MRRGCERFCGTCTIGNKNAALQSNYIAEYNSILRMQDTVIMVNL